ncbi:hypothetical protein JYU34_008598 [Plutella xylostella]|uniref:Uncharacterized protein n=1 Tax=Plutella xylostella TaxID=51655 RepID=A0ABQ7QLG0_PLUXY|nr:hypothetical protein JYU34_008598 [Plutella xylostella]
MTVELGGIIPGRARAGEAERRGGGAHVVRSRRLRETEWRRQTRRHRAGVAPPRPARRPRPAPPAPTSIQGSGLQTPSPPNIRCLYL